MSINLSIDSNGKVKISTGPQKVRLDSVCHFLSCNDDAILVKLEGPHDPSMIYKPGHLCRIEKDDINEQKYIAFVGSHMIGYLPDEAISFAKKVDSAPEFLVSIVGKVDDDGIHIYIAE